LYQSDDATPHRCPSNTPSIPKSILRFSCSLHTANFSHCQLPVDLVQVLELPLLKRLGLVKVHISDASLHSLIHTSCPALECLLLVCNLDFRSLRINSSTLTSIGIYSVGGELIIEDAMSLKRLLHDICNCRFKLTVLSAPKLDTLGQFFDCEFESSVTFGSTVCKVLQF
jgi:hypothetical protein